MAENRKMVYFDGTKTSLLWDEETDAWNYSSNAPGSAEGDFFRTIPVVFRGVNIISNALTKVPFTLWRGDKEYDTSDDWKNTVGCIPNPGRMFWLISQSLDRHGCAYVLKVKNTAKLPTSLKWLSPGTITPVLDEKEGLTGFKRRIGSKEYPIAVDDMIYFWLTDSDVEVGPPQAYPLKAALAAAGVLGNLNDYMAGYFGRGAIRPLIITAKNVTGKDERDRMESWLNKLMGGIKRAFTWKIFNADTVDFQQIGDGLDQLQNLSLTADQRQDVALALGIPQTILFANSANYATSLSDQRNFYDMTIIPRCDFVSGVLNEQLFKPMKLDMEFDPNSLDMYQEDESERSQSLTNYVNSGFTLLMACDVLGIDLTDKQRVELEAEKLAKEERRREMAEMAALAAAKKPEEEEEEKPVQVVGVPGNGAVGSQEGSGRVKMSGDMYNELSKWYRVAMRSWKAGREQPDFQSIIIPPGLRGAISGALMEAKSNDDIARGVQ